VTKSGAQYRLRIAPRVALLDLKRESNVFLKKTLKEIFYELLVDRERFFPHDIELNFEGLDERYDQILMDDESVIDFIKRHCRRLGLYFYFRHAPLGSKTHRDTLVIDNRANGYMRSIDVPFVPASGMDGRFHEALLSLKLKQTLLPRSVELRDHNYRTPQAPVSAIAYVDRGDKTLYGSIDRSNEHFHSKEEAQTLTTVRAQAIASRQVIHTGTTNIAGLYPGWVLNTTNHKLPKAPYGLVIVKCITTGSLSKPVTNQFEATPADKVWRPEYVPARDWKWMQGSIVATIESSAEGSPYPDLDEHGRYLARFHFHHGAGKSGSNSMRLRLMTPSASKDGGFHAPLLPGTEVRIFFTNSDIDRPYIAFAAHDYSHANHVHGYEGWNSRSVWRSALLANKMRFEDFKGREGAKLATIFQKSSVSMGYLVDNQKQRRGEGIEIHSQGHGTYHASKGLFFSADALSNPNAPHLEMNAALRELQSALNRVTSLVQATTQAKADPADRDTQAALMDTLDQLKSAGLLASAPGGMAFVTPRSLQQAAGENVIVNAGKHVDVSAVRRFTVAAGELISLCALKLGLKLFANGPVDIQAHDSTLNLYADQQLHVSSANADVLVNGKTRAVLACGGAAIKIENGSIELVCPGDFRIKAGSFTFEGPQNADTPLPKLPESEFKLTNHYPLTR
jgi:type VI secretion system secreted protein VgrG